MNSKLALKIICFACKAQAFSSFNIFDVWATVFPQKEFPKWSVSCHNSTNLKEYDYDTAIKELLDVSIDYLSNKIED